MKTLIITGLIVTGYPEDLDINKQGGCYFCKRKPEDRGVNVVIEAKTPVDVELTKLNFQFHQASNGASYYFLCSECETLLESFQLKN